MIDKPGISTSDLMRTIVDKSISAVKPQSLFGEQFAFDGHVLHAFSEKVEFREDGQVKCVAIGKAAEAMAHQIALKLGTRVSGIIATPVSSHLDVPGFRFFKTGHPYPDEQSLMAGKAVFDFVRSSGNRDVIIFLISGGGSASVFVPTEGVTLADANRAFEVLIKNAISIKDINLLRRHLSALGGGKLAELVPKCGKLSLVISDVVGNNPSAVASGPSVEDNSTPQDALSFLRSSKLIDSVPASVPKALERMSSDFKPVKLENNSVRVIASNSDALRAAKQIGSENLFNTMILNSSFEGSVAEASDFLISIASEIELNSSIIAPPAIVLFGGETVVDVSGNGIGGRNQHLVLSAIKRMHELMMEGKALKRTTVFSFGTDGRDGNSDAAGAFGSLETFSKIDDVKNEAEKYLATFDSNSFFKKYGGLIETGPTDTNVMDVFGMVVE